MAQALGNYGAKAQQFITLFTAIFNKAPTPDLIVEGAAFLSAPGADAGQLIDVLFAHPVVPYTAFKPGLATPNAFLTQLIDNLSAGSSISAEDKALWVAALGSDYTDYVVNGGYTQGQFAVALVNLLTTLDLPAGSSLEVLQNNILSNAETAAELGYNSTATFTTWAGLLSPSQEAPASGAQYLEVTRDALTGTAGDDTFIADIFDNQNTLQSGDTINGGGGFDTLYADIGNSQKFAITPNLNSVEKVVFRAQAERADSGDNNIANPVNVVDLPTLYQAAQNAITNLIGGIGNGGDIEDIAGALLNFAKDGRGSQIDAERSVGVTHWESRNSRADLVIEDVRIASGQITKDITIAFVQSDPGNVDFAVYFDQHSLRKDADTTIAPRKITLELLDLRGFVDEGQPLLELPLTGFRIRLTDGTDILIDGGDAVNNATTYPALVAALNAAVASNAELIAAGLVDNFKFSLGTAFTATGTTSEGEVLNGAGTRIVLDLVGDNVPASIGFASTPAGLSTSGFVFNPNEVTAEFRYNQQTLGSPQDVNTLITSTVILDDVGRGSTGGDLLIGGLSVGDTSNSRGVEQFDIYVDRSSKLQTISSTNNTLEVVNLWNRDYDADADTVANGDLTVTGSVGSYGYGLDLVDSVLGGGLGGILQLPFAPFHGPLGSSLNLPVNGYYYSNGAANQDRYITEGPNKGKYVAFGEDGKGKFVGLGSNDLALPGAEHANSGFGFTDVRVINASEFVGRTNLSLELTYQVAEKYLNNKDAAPSSPAADDVTFQYDLGTNADIFQLELSALSLGVAGTSSFKDFILNIDGGAGADSISVHIADAIFYSGVEGGIGDDGHKSWYWNSKQNAQLSIDAGTGDDVVRTVGTGDWNVKLGEGNDTYYADNTGAAAYWVLNALNDDILDLDTGINDKHALFKTKLTVELTGQLYGNKVGGNGFKSIEVEIPHDGYKTTDLHINQAIKKAINSDPVLSKLLEAVDGPGASLIVRSLIDGNHLAGDLTVSLKAPTSLTNAEWQGYANAHKLVSADEAGVLALIAADVAAQTTATGVLDGVNGEYWPQLGDVPFTITGGLDSHNQADNHVEGGLGDDVIVLGTGRFSNDTVVYTGLGNGRDTIVNFDDTFTPAGFKWSGGGTGVKEKVTLTFQDAMSTGAAQTLIFDGQTITLSAPTAQGVIPAEDIAYQFSKQFNSANWEVDTHALNTGVVVLVAKTEGDKTDVVIGDFTGTLAPKPTPSVTTPGTTPVVNATASTFTVEFDVTQTAANGNGSIDFDTASIGYLQGDGAVTLAHLLNGAANPFTNWTESGVTTSGNKVSVTFTATTPGTAATSGIPLPTAANFDLDQAGIVGSITVTEGTDQYDQTLVPVPFGPAEGTDRLDFSSYANVDHVVVNGAVIVGGTLTTTGGDSYVTLTENHVGNPGVGVYTIDLVTLNAAGTGVATTQLIGVADFGEHKDFHDFNFVV